MPGWLIPVIAADLVITAVVLWFAFRRRSRATRRANPAMLGAFSNATHPIIGDYMRANWSGMAEQLPGVLHSLLDDLERQAESRSLPIDRPALKLVMARSLASHGIGEGSQIRTALENVA